MCPQVQATTTYPRAFEIRSNPLRDLRLCRVRLIVRLEIRFVHSHFLDLPCFRCFRSRRVLCEIQFFFNWSETKEVYTAAQLTPAAIHAMIHAPSSTTGAKLESPTRYTLPSGCGSLMPAHHQHQRHCVCQYGSGLQQPSAGQPSLQASRRPWLPPAPPLQLVQPLQPPQET